MIRIRLAMLIGALPLLSACSDRVPTMPDVVMAPFMSKGAHTSRPFHGRCDSAVEFVAPQPGDPLGSVRLQLTSVCQLSHLGRTTAVGDELIVFTSANTGNATRTTVYTAANGDQLFATWNGTGVTDAIGGVVFSGTEVYTGGTGRFENASGSSSLSGTGTFAGAPPFPGQFTFAGTLSN